MRRVPERAAPGAPSIDVARSVEGTGSEVDPPATAAPPGEHERELSDDDAHSGAPAPEPPP